MDPLTVGLISGGASLLGSVFSSNTSAQNTQQQIAGQQQMQAQSEAFNASQAQMNRDFQQQMSSTAYQRASSDMKAAGLNPAMMFGSGSAASSLSGSSASIGTPTMPTPQRTSPLAGIGDAASKMVSSAIQAKTYDKMVEEVANLQTDRARIAAATGLLGAETGLVGQRTKTEVEETEKRAAEKLTARAGTHVSALKAAEADAVGKMPTWLFNTINQSGYVGGKVSDTIEPATQLFNSAMRSRGLDLLREKMGQSRHSTEHYDVRPGGYTRNREEWSQ